MSTAQERLKNFTRGANPGAGSLTGDILSLLAECERLEGENAKERERTAEARSEAVRMRERVLRHEGAGVAQSLGFRYVRFPWESEEARGAGVGPQPEEVMPHESDEHGATDVPRHVDLPAPAPSLEERLDALTDLAMALAKFRHARWYGEEITTALARVESLRPKGTA